MHKRKPIPVDQITYRGKHITSLDKEELMTAISESHSETEYFKELYKNSQMKLIGETRNREIQSGLDESTIRSQRLWLFVGLVVWATVTLLLISMLNR